MRANYDVEDDQGFFDTLLNWHYMSASKPVEVKPVEAAPAPTVHTPIAVDNKASPTESIAMKYAKIAALLRELATEFDALAG